VPLSIGQQQTNFSHVCGVYNPGPAQRPFAFSSLFGQYMAGMRLGIRVLSCSGLPESLCGGPIGFNLRHVAILTYKFKAFCGNH